MKSKVFARDLSATATQLVSRASGPQGAPAADSADGPEISGDGRFVAFYSSAANLGTAPPAGTGYFERDLAGAQTRYLADSGVGGLEYPSPSFDGRCVAFDSQAGDLLPGKALGTDFSRVYLWAASGECPNVGPQTSIVAGPRGATRVRRPPFRLRSSKPGSTFRCRLDGDGFASCRSPYRPPALADGRHTVFVTATDAAGNGDATPATRTFTVDTHSPALSKLMVKGQAHHPARISFRLSETAKVAVAIVRCRAVRHRRCVRPHTVTTLTKARAPKGANSVLFTERVHGKRLSAGRYEARATPIDPAGNRGLARVVLFRVR